MAQAARISTTPRAPLATGAIALTVLSAEFDSLTAYEARLWRGFDGDNANVSARIKATQRQLDAVLSKIDRLPGATIDELRLKARAAAYFAPPELPDDATVHERLVAGILNSLAA